MAPDTSKSMIRPLANKIKFKKLDPRAIIPRAATSGSAGLDLHLLEDVVIWPQQTVRAPTGLAMQLLPYTVAFIKPRSSAFFKGLDLDGTIDADYRGPLLLQIRNCGDEKISLKAGDRVAQLVILTYVHNDVEEVDQLDETERGEKGFGSTGA